MTPSGNKATRAPRFGLFSVIVIALALIYATCLFVSVEQENETNDEPAHIVAGYSYWIKGDFRLNPEHPPLSKLLCALPLLVLKPDFPNDPTAWNEADQFQLGKELLYGAPDGGHRILLACRSVSILFTTAFGVFLAFWARRRFSSRIALLIFVLFLLDPNIAAHGRYVTSDIFITAFFFITTVYWYDWLCDRKNANLWLSSIALGLALASKFSGVLLFPVMAAMFVIHRWFALRTSAPQVLPRLNTPKVLSVLVLVPAAIVLCCYAGDSRSVSTDPLISARLNARGQEPSTWQCVPVPGYYWLRGLQIIAKHQTEGHATPAYLMGKLTDTGFIAYFPVAIFVKTPTGTLTLLVAALLLCFSPRAFPGGFSLSLALTIPMLLYLLVSIGSRIDIGIRHILLLYPFFYVLVGASAQNVRGRTKEIFICVALLINLIEIVRVYPHQIAFFNTLAGGPNNGARYLIDSNLDWGQGLIHLRDDLAKRQYSCLALGYFGRAKTDYYFQDARPIPANASQAKEQHCLIAVSVQLLYGNPNQTLSYLLKYQPLARPGYSMYVYDPSRF